MSQRFTKIIHRENETEIVLPIPHVQKGVGVLLFLIGLGIGFPLFGMLETEIRFGDANSLLFGLLVMLPCFLFAVMCLIFSIQMFFSKPKLIIDLENIQFESGGYFKKRRKAYPRSDFVRLDRNFVRESKHSQKYPTLELQLKHDTIRIICADSQEQTEIELLLREIFSTTTTENESEPTRGFHVQIRQEDKKLVLEQPPQKWAWFPLFFILFFGTVFIVISIKAYHAPRNPQPLWITISSVLLMVALFGNLVFLWVRTFWGHYVYTFERRTLTIDFRCPGFHRQWIYYYADIQSIKPDQISSNRGGKIDRCVAIKISWKTYRILVRSEEEQQYICTLIRQFISA